MGFGEIEFIQNVRTRWNHLQNASVGFGHLASMDKREELTANIALEYVPRQWRTSKIALKTTGRTNNEKVSTETGAPSKWEKLGIIIPNPTPVIRLNQRKPKVQWPGGKGIKYYETSLSAKNSEESINILLGLPSLKEQSERVKPLINKYIP